MPERLDAVDLLVRVALLGLVLPVALAGAATAVPGAESFVVLSGSMEPTLSPGDLVLVRAGDYEPGDVVSYARGETVVTHRLVERTPRGWTTKGDANPVVDARPVPADRIVGEVVLSIPLYGRLIRFVATPLGYVSTVLVPGVLLLGLYGRNLARALR